MYQDLKNEAFKSPFILLELGLEARMQLQGSFKASTSTMRLVRSYIGPEMMFVFAILYYYRFSSIMTLDIQLEMGPPLCPFFLISAWLPSPTSTLRKPQKNKPCKIGQI